MSLSVLLPLTSPGLPPLSNLVIIPYDEEVIITPKGGTMAGYSTDIEGKTLTNTNFRQVLYTGKHTQLVLMSLKPGEDIGAETHDHVDQFFRIEQGTGTVVIDGQETVVKDGSAVIVPAGSLHNVINTSETDDLKLYTLYSPANHPDGTIHVTKAEADVAEAEEHHS